ncbi:MAG: 5'-3' exonuclease H3TH domain-containing protein, partial [Candidatus Eremiobacterota bacterium]
MARFYVIDIMYHIFRAFHALPAHLGTRDGRPTNAVHGCLGILRVLWKTFQPEYAVAVFESRTRVFREEIDPEYKANRPPVPSALKQQIPMVIEGLDRLGIPALSVDGYEADDVMATLAWRAVHAGQPVTVVSSDKDLAQVLEYPGDVELLRVSGTGKTAKVESIRRDQAEKVFGVAPTLIPSLLALRGDTVDNIPGIPGIGQKTAESLLKRSGGLTALLEAPEQAGKFQGALEEQRERLLRDLEIATIRTDVPLPFEGFDVERFKLRPLKGAVEWFQD